VWNVHLAGVWPLEGFTWEEGGCASYLEKGRVALTRRRLFQKAQAHVEIGKDGEKKDSVIQLPCLVFRPISPSPAASMQRDDQGTAGGLSQR